MIQDRLFEPSGPLVELNPTRLATFLACPKEFEFRYIKRTTSFRTGSDAAALGRNVHKALLLFFSLPSEQRTSEAMAVGAASAWDNVGFTSKAAALTARERGLEMLSGFFEIEDHTLARVIALESKLSTRGEGLYVWGRVDRLDRDESGYEIIDYKTGRHVVGPDSLTMSLYALAASRQLDAPVHSVTVYGLAESVKLTSLRSRSDLREDWRAISDVAQQIRRGQFPANPSRRCRFCDFVDVCPEGRDARNHSD